MPRKPSTHRKDANHDQIVELAQAFGWEVVSLTSAGQGIPDLLLWRYPQGFRLVEVKAGKGKRLTAAQATFQQRYGMPVLYLHSVEDARTVFTAIVGEARRGAHETR